MDREIHRKCKQLASEADDISLGPFRQKSFQLLVVLAFIFVGLFPFLYVRLFMLVLFDIVPLNARRNH